MKKKQTKRWKRIVRGIVRTLILLVVLAGAGLYGYSRLKAEYTTTYDEYSATIGSISNSLSFSGSFSVVDSKDYTASSSTTVRTIYVSAGDDVLEGDKLMRLANGETLKADFDGRINTLNVEEGDEVSMNAPLLQLVDFSRMKVSIRIDEYDISDVAIGQACTITATATEKSFTSTIESIDYISSSGGSVAYYTAVTYADVEDGIYPGMQVTVSIPQQEATDVVVLKMDALSFDIRNSAYVLMYDEAGEFEQIYVEVGVSNGNYVEIVSGLSDGDTVYVETKVEAAASGLAGLFSGMMSSRQINNSNRGGMTGMGGDMSNIDFSNFDSGNMPSFYYSGSDGSGSTDRQGGMGGGGQ